jgi:gentisate 1,2-dioxygenase
MSNQAYVIDQSGRQPIDYRPLAPVIITREEIDAEIERLAEGRFLGSRRSAIVHPGLVDGFGLMPAARVSLNVLKPGEKTAPHRHNSSVVNFCLRGGGKSLIAGRTIEFSQHDVWSTPPWAIHQHFNDTDELQVRLSYSNAALLDRLGVHIVEETPDLDPDQPLGDPARELEQSERGEVIGEDGAALLTYEQLISPEPPYQQALHWTWSTIKDRLYGLADELGKDYVGRRLYLLYDPNTGRTQGTTATFFATLGVIPPGAVDVPHRHSSAAINYYFAGSGWSIVGGQKYSWKAGDLMLSAPGWMPHGHAGDENSEPVAALTIQDSPLHIALGSLLWMENLKEGVTAALGSEHGFETNRQAIAAGE